MISYTPIVVLMGKSEYDLLDLGNQPINVFDSREEAFKWAETHKEFTEQYDTLWCEDVSYICKTEKPF